MSNTNRYRFTGVRGRPPMEPEDRLYTISCSIRYDQCQYISSLMDRIGCNTSEAMRQLLDLAIQTTRA